tara:strand:+ start:896 stop:2017 length:1122 start_codon:yes stop_codon:yes gene_type:complete
MARNRVIYQSEALYVGQDASLLAAVNHNQIERTQSANFSYTINRQDINQFGELARIDSLILDPPTVSTDFSYYLTDGFNEQALGFFVNTGAAGVNDGQFASGHLIGSSGRNVFIVTGPEGKDLNGAGAIASDDKTIGIGNCYLSDYSVDLSVGSIPTVSVTMEGANVRADAGGAAIDNPSVDQEAGTPMAGTITLPAPVTGTSTAGISALRPGDVTVSLTAFDGSTVADLAGSDGAHVQSVSLSVPLSRSPLQRLGSRFPFAREVDFPVEVSMSVNALVNEIGAMQLASVLESGFQAASVTVKDEDGDQAVKYTLSGAKIDSESFSSSIGSNQTVDLTISAQIGGTNDISAGLFMEGANRIHRSGFNGRPGPM